MRTRAHIIFTAALATVALAKNVHAGDPPPIACNIKSKTCGKLTAGQSKITINVSPAAGCTVDPKGFDLKVKEATAGHCTVFPPTAAQTTLGIQPFECTLNSPAAPGDYGVSPCTNDAALTSVLQVPAGDKTKASDDAAIGLGFLPEAAWQEALTQLRLPLDGHRLGHYYDSWGNVAVLFFDSDGNPFFPMLDVIDEDDAIFVVVIDLKPRIDGLRVGVTGCDRTPIEPRIYGSGVTATIGTVKSTLPGVPPPPELGYIMRATGNCAGAATGGPQVVLERGSQRTSVVIPVNPLYRLAVGLGFGYDATTTRSFSVQTAPGDTVARVAESDDRVGLFPMVYVSFYPVARDFRKRDFFLVQRFQLFAGIGTRDFLDDFVVGGAYELATGLNVMVGWHALTKQTVLTEGSGLVVGSSFDGTTDAIPTRTRWETGSVFVGVGLSADLFSRLK